MSTTQTSLDNYDALVNNPNIFFEKLRGFSKSLDIHTMGGNTLELHRLFIEVTSRGGFERVIEDWKWEEVSCAYNISKTITSEPSLLKKYYLMFLCEMEHVYFLQKPASSVQPTCVPVQVVMNGEVDNGYLMTLKTGSEELKGVFYYNPQTLVQPQQTIETPSGIVPPSAGVDSQTPKCYRSGYNFFFSEQSARLKLESNGKEGLIPKKIGHMWSNLSESEKRVYEDKGLKDVERYKMQMLEFKSSHESGASSFSRGT